MSSEPIERRVAYIGDRLRGCRCQLCGKEYFNLRDYCGVAERKASEKWRKSTYSMKRAYWKFAHL